MARVNVEKRVCDVYGVTNSVRGVEITVKIDGEVESYKKADLGKRAIRRLDEWIDRALKPSKSNRLIAQDDEPEDETEEVTPEELSTEGATETQAKTEPSPRAGLKINRRNESEIDDL
jgi:hypothetical protein